MVPSELKKTNDTVHNDGEKVQLNGVIASRIVPEFYFKYR